MIRSLVLPHGSSMKTLWSLRRYTFYLVPKKKAWKAPIGKSDARFFQSNTPGVLAIGLQS